MAKKKQAAKSVLKALPAGQGPAMPGATPVSDTEIVVSNTAFIMSAQLLTGAFSFILVVAIARHLGNVGLGSYSTAVALSAVLMQLLDFGVPTYAVKEIARRKEAAAEYISSMMGLRLALSIGMLLFAAAALSYLNASSHITSLTTGIIGLTILATTLSFLAEPLRAAFLAYEKHFYYSAILITERLIFFAFALAMLLTGHGIIMVMLGFAISTAAALILNAAVVWKKFSRFTLKFEPAKWKRLLKGGLPFWLSALLMTAYSKIDTLMLSGFKGFTATGFYNSAYKIVDSFTLIPLAVSFAFYPTLSRLFKSRSNALGILYKKAFYYLITAALPMGVAFTLLADRVIRLLYGPEFGPAAIALQILIWAELFIFLNYLMGCMLYSIDKQNLFTISTGAYALINILLNLAIIPRFSYAGAAAVALITQTLQAATLYYFCRKSGYGAGMPGILYRPALASIAMGTAILLLQQLHLLIIAPAAAATYMAALILLRGLTADDLTIVKGLLARTLKR